MKKYAADNLLFLRKEYPNIYHYVRERIYDKQKIEIVQARNGQANLCVKDEAGNRHLLYSRYNPELEVQKWLNLLDEQTRSAKHVLFYGFGLGYHIEAFLEAFPDKLVYVIEPDTDIFLATMEARDLRPILENKKVAIFAVGKDPLIEQGFLESIYQLIKDSFVYLIAPAIYRKLREKDIAVFAEQISSVILRVRSNIHTSFRFQEEWAENVIQNIRHMLHSYPFDGMKNACRGIPALVVGSGPSLNMDLDVLRKLKGRVLIISAGSAVQALLRNGIEPDLMVSIDPNVNNHKVFAELDIREIPFLYCSTIKHTILDRDLPYLTHIHLSNNSISLYLMDVKREEPKFFSTSTVTGTAIQAAIYMGCSEIVLVGQDFSYPNDQYYASGVQHVAPEEIKKRVDEADEFVENVSGGLNRTNKSMKVLKASVELVINTFDFSEYYNASRIGAKIEYTRPKTLQQVYEARKAHDMGERWFRELMLARLEKYPPERVKQVEQRVLETSRELKELVDLLDGIRACLRKAKDLAPGDRASSEAWLINFSELWNKAIQSKVFQVFYGFLLRTELNVVQRYFLEMNEEPDPNAKIVSIRPVMKAFLSGAERVNPILLDNLEDLIKKMEWEWEGEGRNG